MRWVTGSLAHRKVSRLENRKLARKTHLRRTLPVHSWDHRIYGSQFPQVVGAIVNDNPFALMSVSTYVTTRELLSGSSNISGLVIEVLEFESDR